MKQIVGGRGITRQTPQIPQDLSLIGIHQQTEVVLGLRLVCGRHVIQGSSTAPSPIAGDAGSTTARITTPRAPRCEMADTGSRDGLFDVSPMVRCSRANESPRAERTRDAPPT